MTVPQSLSLSVCSVLVLAQLSSARRDTLNCQTSVSQSVSSVVSQSPCQPASQPGHRTESPGVGDDLYEKCFPRVLLTTEKYNCDNNYNIYTTHTGH